MARRGAISLAVAALACLALCASPAGAFSGPEIVQLLSAQRDANGIPGGLAERPDWSAACAQHNHYEAQTGELTHFEDPSSPFYTDGGAWAGQNSVLAAGYGWSEGNPWENAPIHLIQMLGPALAELGAAESEGYNCATTWPGYTRPEPSGLVAYSYPGDGSTGVIPSEIAAESPFIPGDFVGLPQGTTTGRYLLAYLRGYVNLKRDEEVDEVRASASLTGPAGPVEVRVVDSAAPEVGAFMPASSVFVIPVQPLMPNSGYSAAIDWSAGGVTLTEQHFAFTTGTDPVESDATPIRKLVHRPCSRYARKARLARRRARKLRRHAVHLAKKPNSPRELRRARRLMRKSRKAKRRARRLSRRAKRCRHKAKAEAKSLVLG